MLQEGEQDLCVSVRDCVCASVKKDEVKDSEYIPTGMKAHRQPSVIISFMTKRGCGGGGVLKKEDKYPASPWPQLF